MFEIDKVINYGKFQLKFRGVPKNETIKEEEIEMLIDNFLYKRDHSNMARSISDLRTIFRNYNEKQLIVRVHKDEFEETAVYENGELSLYIKKQGVLGKGYEFSYDLLGLKYKCDNVCNDISNFDERHELLKKEFDKVMSDISLLSKIKPNELTYEDKKVIEIYRYFYKEEPDFASNDVKDQIQSMLCILSCFPGTKLNYTFDWSSEREYPENLSIRWNLNNLYPFGKTGDLEFESVLDGDAKKIIEVIGTSVKEVIGDVSNCKDLVNLSKVMYIYMHFENKKNPLTRMEQISECSPEQFELGISLVKSLKNKITK